MQCMKRCTEKLTAEKGLTALVRLAVCDDDRIMVEYISDKLREYYGECEINKYKDGESLLADSRRQLFDALFLDIDMPGMDGMELAEKIRKGNKYVKIIFVTNKDNLVYKALKYIPFRYIRKNYFDEEFSEAVEALKKSIAESNHTVMFNTKSGDICIKVRDIIYAEVFDHTVKVHLQNDTFETWKTLDSLEKEILNFGFIRIHKSFLVNYRNIALVEDKNIILNTEEKIPMSRKRIKEVKLQLQIFSRNR